jgi:POT family proton-dependent oligopeptide transporter
MGRPREPEQWPDTRFYGHPRGLATLFFTEMWERFSYYGMRAILILYMVAPTSSGGLGFSVAKGGAVYGFYTAMVYLLSLPGGWVADRIIGQQKAVLYGGILISAGEFSLTAPGLPWFYLGLVLLMVGTGLLKPNVSTIVGQLYKPNDVRRDSGFSIFYMGINIGALSPLICSYLGERVSWRLGFGAAGVGMLAGLIQYVLSGKYLGDAGLRPRGTGDPLKDRRQKRHGMLAAMGALAMVAMVAVLSRTGIIDLTAESISDALGWLLLITSLAVFAWLIFGPSWSAIERKRAVAILVLFVSSAIFWAAYEQAGSSLNLFAERNTDRHVLGWEFPAGWFQFVQPVFVILLAPLFAWLWIALRHREPSIPAKFAGGLLLGGLAFALLVPAAGGSKMASPWWLTGTYLLQALGELCLSPVGLSAMTKLAPARVAGFVMGVWFLSISIGDWAAGKAASFYESMALPNLFGAVAALSLVAVLLMAVMIKPTVRLMAGVK